MILLKNLDIKPLQGLIFSLIAIAIVFIILVIIILIVSLLSKINFAKFDKKKAAPAKPAASVSQKKLTIEDIKDDDMMVAALVATAEFVEETKEKDARLVSIKQIG